MTPEELDAAGQKSVDHRPPGAEPTGSARRRPRVGRSFDELIRYVKYFRVACPLER